MDLMKRRSFYTCFVLSSKKIKAQTFIILVSATIEIIKIKESDLNIYSAIPKKMAVFYRYKKQSSVENRSTADNAVRGNQAVLQIKSF